ncbi:MAG: TMEM165/GDT1 family protein [Polyangia bacterium]
MSSIELFFTVFGVIFVAELPDKTALAALVLATRHRALPVFLGTGLALTVQSLVAVAAGALVAKLPETWVHLGSGIVFLGCAIWMWVRKEEVEDTKGDDEPAGFWRTFATVFGVVFIAEWGDLTQIGTAALQARYHAWVIVLAASSLALWAVAAIVVFIGNRTAKFLDPQRMQKVAALMFAIIGGVLVYKAVRGMQ